MREIEDMSPYRMTVRTQTPTGDRVEVLTVFGDSGVAEERDYQRGVAGRGNIQTITVEDAPR
jgi:hypothetical protein